MVGTCECGNEPFGIIKCSEFIDWLTRLHRVSKVLSEESET